jgi:NAD(P)-dependent dehydrogenase (short-subunit alcohol dehydrogenase family)
MGIRERFLQGKVAIVTGGGRGIGAATAEVLAWAGATVTIAARTSKEIEAVANRISRADGKALAVPTDVADPDQVRVLVDRTLDAFARIDFLINIAGFVLAMGKPTWEVDPAVWRRAIEVNLMGVLLTSHAVLPHMLRQRSGRLLNLSSRAAEVPISRASAYCTAKAGVNHLTRVLALELRGTGITANTFNPGPADTPTLDKVHSALFPNVPRRALEILRRDPIEPASMILWLCSPATSQMTGAFVSWNDPIIQRQIAHFRQRYALG